MKISFNMEFYMHILVQSGHMYKFWQTKIIFFIYDSTCFPRNIVLKLSDEIQLLGIIWSISEYITQWLFLCHVYAMLQNQRVSTHMRVYDILSLLMADFSTSFPEIRTICYYKEFFPVANAAVQ